MTTLITVVCCALMLLAPSAVGAQPIDPEVQRLIEDQGRRIDALQKQLDEMRALVAGLQAAPPLVLPASVPADTQSRRPYPDIPPDVVSAGDFPGSFKIPGSDAAVKVGGLVRVNWVTTFDPLLVSDRFITSDIPVDVVNAPVGGRVDVMAIPSRFNLDFRTPTGVGYVRAFLEGDFAGSGNTLRLRHAYGQWRHFLFGQTWSTFSDPEAEPDGIDFEGLNATVKVRQPQVRWTSVSSGHMRFALSLENATTELTGATAADQRPDVVSRIRWQTGQDTHVQAAALLREVRGFPSNAPSQIVSGLGWGVNLSGKLPSPLWTQRDRVLFQINRGAGIGHYITDLVSDGGQDGVFDTTAGIIRVLHASSAYGSYDHYWTSDIHSSFTAGVVGVRTLDIQPGSALQRTRRYSGNIIWSPEPRLELVAEFLYGMRANRDTHRQRASQMQIGSTFRF